MKIIKRGTIQSQREYRANCRTCDTVFQFAQWEGKVTKDQRDGDFVSIACPVCSMNISKFLKDYVVPDDNTILPMNNELSKIDSVLLKR